MRDKEGQRSNVISVATMRGRQRANWPDALPNNLARRIRWFRELRDYTQMELAELAGVSQSAVSDAESGQCVIHLRTLYLLARALETTVSVLLGEVERPADVMALDAERRRF